MEERLLEKGVHSILNVAHTTKRGVQSREATMMTGAARLYRIISNNSPGELFFWW